MDDNPEHIIDFEIAKAETIKRRQFNPYRKIMGKNPTPTEMAAWSHDQWMDFLRFTAIFIERNHETQEEKFKFTEEKRALLDEFLSIPNHPFQELIYRVDKWLGEHDNSEYRHKFQSIVRVVLGYLKIHPSIISPNMKVLIDSYPKRLGWVLAQYKVVGTRAGDVVDRDTGTDTNAQIKLPSIQTKLLNSLVNIADFYELVSGSLHKKDIAGMTVVERIKTLKDLGFIFTTATKRQQTNHLTQININTKDVKGVEEAMLDYVKKTQEK